MNVYNKINHLQPTLLSYTGRFSICAIKPTRKKQFYILLLVFSFSIFSTIYTFAQKHDTLINVKIEAVAFKNPSTSITPSQELNAKDLTKTNSANVADAVKQFAGVQVKDYGGVGGLKTISVRSLGANHTGIFYDGLAINDAQGGQIDLGKFSLDNIEQIQLYNSTPTEILLPARAFSTASLLLLKSNSSVINKNENQSLKIQLQQGSFGYFSPSVALKKRFGANLQMAFTGWYQTATNKYPFLSYQNTSVKEKRKNSDVNAYRVEYDAAYINNDSNKIKFKAYFANSKRGLPGSIIFFSNTGNQRLNEANFFSQINWQKKIKKRHEILLGSKFSADNIYYIDPSFLNSAGKLENEFHQQEYYISAAYKYKFAKNIKLAYASDFFTTSLKRTDTFAVGFANPKRNSLLNNISLAFKNERYEIAANILHTSIKESVENGISGKNFNAFTPAFAGSFKPFSLHDFYLRGFYKNIFRAPTFNDLYYTNVGNTNLKPEYAAQFNVGIMYNKYNFTSIQQLTITADGYQNNVTDKILAVPRQNLFQWSMQNIGKVKITGLDATLHIVFKPWKQIKISSAVSYTLQQVLDLSDASSPLYKTQLPYTPVHTSSVNLNVVFQRTTLSYNFIGSSLRYRQGDQIPENALNPWSSHDFSLAYDVNQSYKIIFAANNILNAQYDIVKFYPMPRFNYRISFLLNLKKNKK